MASKKRREEGEEKSAFKKIKKGDESTQVSGKKFPETNKRTS